MNANQIAAKYGVEPEAVEGWRLVDGGATIRALVNYGIGGIKVYQFPADQLTAPEPEPEAPPLPVPAVIDLNEQEASDDLTVAELRDIARDRGVAYSGLRKDELIEALRAWDEEE